jgi:uncharacterized protein (TIGR02145 family)
MKKESSISAIVVLAFTIFLTGCKKDEKTPDPLSDSDGNIYKTVKIGTQTWMAENLKTTRFNDGTPISLVGGDNEWRELTAPGYCWYNNDEASFKDPYGALYNWYTAATGKLCPSGWHIPEKEEWLTLGAFLNDSVKAGGKLKEAGTAHWLTPNKGADNSSGFSALGSGIRYFEGTYASNLSYTSIWSNTENEHNEVWYISLFYAETELSLNHRNKKYGFSVRCLKDK